MFANYFSPGRFTWFPKEVTNYVTPNNFKLKYVRFVFSNNNIKAPSTRMFVYTRWLLVD